MRLPEDKDINSAGDDYVSLLRAKLTSLRETAAACIASKEYQRAGLLIPEMQNIFKEGDLILRVQTRISFLVSSPRHTRVHMSCSPSIRMISRVDTPT